MRKIHSHASLMTMAATILCVVAFSMPEAIGAGPANPVGGGAAGGNVASGNGGSNKSNSNGAAGKGIGTNMGNFPSKSPSAFPSKFPGKFPASFPSKFPGKPATPASATLNNVNAPSTSPSINTSLASVPNAALDESVCSKTERKLSDNAACDQQLAK